jgi:hypothetical protein
MPCLYISIHSEECENRENLYPEDILLCEAIVLQSHSAVFRQELRPHYQFRHPDGVLEYIHCDCNPPTVQWGLTDTSVITDTGSSVLLPQGTQNYQTIPVDPFARIFTVDVTCNGAALPTVSTSIIYHQPPILNTTLTCVATCVGTCVLNVPDVNQPTARYSCSSVYVASTTEGILTYSYGHLSIQPTSDLSEEELLKHVKILLCQALLWKVLSKRW